MESTTSPSRGKFILVFGPTGSGKSVLLSYIRTNHPELVYPISYTTRAKRPGHENSSYRFVSVEEFNRLKEEGAMLEWAQFGDNYYATPKDEVEAGLAGGKVLFKEMELQGVQQTREIISSEELIIIYIDAGSWDDLSRRVLARAPITDEELAKRKSRYEEEVEFKGIASYVVENRDGKLNEAKAELTRIIKSILSSTHI
jgi:guanylate kinase